MPIYYVISERIIHPYATQYDIRQIIAVYACDILDIDRIWQNYVASIASQRNIYAEIFLREPANPFKERAIEEWD